MSGPVPATGPSPIDSPVSTAGLPGVSWKSEAPPATDEDEAATETTGNLLRAKRRARKRLDG